LYHRKLGVKHAHHSMHWAIFHCPQVQVVFGCFNIVNNDVDVMLILLAIKDDWLLGLISRYTSSMGIWRQSYSPGVCPPLRHSKLNYCHSGLAVARGPRIESLCGQKVSVVFTKITAKQLWAPAAHWL